MNVGKAEKKLLEPEIVPTGQNLPFIFPSLMDTIPDTLQKGEKKKKA